MNPEQTALLSVAVRLTRPALSKQQQAVCTNLRKQARERRSEILSRRKLAVAAQNKVLSALRAEYDAEYESVTSDLKQALDDSNLSLERATTERLTNIAESGTLGMYIAAQEAM